MQFDSILVIGPTASGKTNLAVWLANQLNSFVISADSRQVYKELTIGSGKDLASYTLHGKQVPYQLIDCCTLAKEFNLVDFVKAHQQIKKELLHSHVLPVICGGSGMYTESMLEGFDLFDEPLDLNYRKHLESLSRADLIALAHSVQISEPELSENSYRLIRKIELKRYKGTPIDIDPYHPKVFGLQLPVQERWNRIQTRLEQRFKEGMLDEVESLLAAGISPQRLIRLGLEYKYLVFYLQKKLSFEEMKNQLYIEIRKFSKRQMTYFRKLETNGIQIQWLDAMLTTEELGQICLNQINSNKIK
jgi:tRNA dimethylallyltransferase